MNKNLVDNPEVVVNPSSWESVLLENCLSNPPRYGLNAAATSYKLDLPTYLRITDISPEGKYLPSPKVGVDHPLSNQYVLESGDIVFARTGASVGKSYLHDSINGKLVFAGFLIQIKCESSKLLPSYLRHYANTSSFWSWVASESSRTGQPGLNAVQLKGMHLQIPPIEEQGRICSILDNLENLIDYIDKLIAKKRDIKQGSMQQLLTGRTRLPGFSGEWQVQRLGDIAAMSSGGTPPSKVNEFYGGEIKWASIADMTKTGKYLSDTDEKLTDLGLLNSSAVIYKSPIILYAMYASLGEVCICLEEVSSSQAILGISPSSRIDLEFLYYLLVAYKPIVKSLGQQGTQSNLNKGMVQDFLFTMPTDKIEQQAIAEVLSDMDAEIDALVARRAKTALIKTGMMQELLIGRARLL